MAKIDDVGEPMRFEWDNDPFNQEVWELLHQVHEDLDGSLLGLREMADKGSTLAAICLGDMLFYGYHDTVRDELEAIAWARHAARRGSIEGGFQLAEYLEKTGSLQAAESEYIKLAERGYVPAMYRLARKYWSDATSEESEGKSIAYFKQAIEGGHLHARADFAKLKRKGTFGFWNRIVGVFDFFALLVPMTIMYYLYPDGDIMRR